MFNLISYFSKKDVNYLKPFIEQVLNEIQEKKTGSGRSKTKRRKTNTKDDEDDYADKDDVFEVVEEEEISSSPILNTFITYYKVIK